MHKSACRSRSSHKSLSQWVMRSADTRTRLFGSTVDSSRPGLVQYGARDNRTPAHPARMTADISRDLLGQVLHHPALRMGRAIDVL